MLNGIKFSAIDTQFKQILDSLRNNSENVLNFHKLGFLNFKTNKYEEYNGR